eukprot:1161540-Pelagomonas_calceolata.AAC.4
MKPIISLIPSLPGPCKPRRARPFAGQRRRLPLCRHGCDPRGQGLSWRPGAWLQRDFEHLRMHARVVWSTCACLVAQARARDVDVLCALVRSCLRLTLLCALVRSCLKLTLLCALVCSCLKLTCQGWAHRTDIAPRMSPVGKGLSRQTSVDLGARASLIHTWADQSACFSVPYPYVPTHQ